MDWRVFSFALYELILSFFFGLITVFIVYKLFNMIFLKINPDDKLKENNIAVGILTGSAVIAVLIMTQTSILPAINSLQVIVLGSEKITFGMYILSFVYFIVFYVITLTISLVVLFSSIALYMFSTKKIEETKEIKNNNIAIAILLSLILIGMSVFISPSTQRFLTSMVNYEAINKMKERTKNADQTDTKKDTNNKEDTPIQIEVE